MIIEKTYNKIKDTWHSIPVTKSEYNVLFSQLLENHNCTLQEWEEYNTLKDKFEPFINDLKQKNYLVYNENSPWYYLPISDQSYDSLEYIKDFLMNHYTRELLLKNHNISEIPLYNENLIDQKTNDFPPHFHYIWHLENQYNSAFLSSFSCLRLSNFSKIELLNIEGVLPEAIDEIEILLKKFGLNFKTL